MARGSRPRPVYSPSFGYRMRAVAVVFVAAGAVVGAGLVPGAAASAARSNTHITSAASVGNGTSCVPNGTGSTCTGAHTGWDNQLPPAPGDTINPNGAYLPDTMLPTVTVDQTSNLTNQMVHVSWTNFPPTFTLVNGNNVNGYNPGAGASFYPVSIFECKGTDPQNLDTDCNSHFTNQGVSQNGVEPNGVESLTLGGQSVNDCTMDTGNPTCGTGFADIQVQTSVQNNLLGCDDLHPCSIVVEPDWGGNSQTGNCDDHTVDWGQGLGAINYASNSDAGWYNPCAWKDRIVVSISFAKTPKTYCPSNAYQFVSEGSPALERAMNQWRPVWCTAAQNPLVFDYNSGVNEFQARNDFLSGNFALTASTDMALVNDPASADQTGASSRKFTYAPIATTGIAVAYYVDDQLTEEPFTTLKLNARLLAKLLTESYSLQFNQCSTSGDAQSATCDPGVVGNPQSIFQDPEFLNLNSTPSRTLTAADFNFGAAANSGDFLPIVLAGNSDMTFELTRWIASDPEARAFLEGQPDQWGMHVNTYYQKGESYPISQFGVLDPGYSAAQPNPGAVSATMQIAWNPVTGLDNVAADLASWTSSGENFFPGCSIPGDQPPCPLVNPKNAPENFPQRTLFAVMDQGTAAAFRFPTAQLVNPAGNAVGPSTVSMSAAVGAMKTNPDKITQYQDYGATSPNAYPLTEVQYAMVPTCGVSQAKVQAISAFLNDVAGSAQLYGTDIGELPPFGGYLALNDAQKAQTLAAAQAVSSQDCVSPPSNPTVSGVSGSGSSVSSGGSAGLPPSLPSFAANTPGSSLSPLAAPGATIPNVHLSPSPSRAVASGQQPVGLGTKSADSSDFAKTVLIVGLVIGALLAIGGPLTYAFGTGSLRFPAGRRRPGSGGEF